ncbi:MAG: aminodeoxychorismate/anthranilate synthase component II [Alphaproteobacteria bacterium]|nr:aminodeoxychorismate/anthranilate synthase component II [Alphaproteobacteria bacterium]
MLLLIDNYDSFTYNLLHYLGELGAEVRVIRNDALPVEGILALKPSAVVISPGPGTPDDSGVCLDLIKKAGDKLPMLGVCLGHQAMAQAFGGKVVRAPEPMHGKISPIRHHNTSVFKGLPSPFDATRYHSLVADRGSFPDVLEITAETEDGLIMGLRHKKYNLHGVQFHPESIASEHGHALLKNFLELAR